eukprot:2650395-Amphidinium_carterae.1
MTTTVEQLVLVAGGIGVTPLYAMARHWHSLAESRDEDLQQGTPTLTMLYSAKRPRDLTIVATPRKNDPELHRRAASQQIQGDKKLIGQ